MTLKDEMRALVAKGLDVSTALSVFAELNSEYAKRHIEAARQQWEREGEIEIDEISVISGSSDNGEYVLAWVWVDDPAAQPQHPSPAQ